ncbi:putative membrane protein [Halanaeroarchaeum sp. HSR-CO]|uniref:hypothetical protein n=1 Tax=Halanaeroarchaeum sp. HSR-CO TaxID=2866382 RepID=UPI00217E6644|nr:hypothetical protein [Halanaeroarchaeum sp. HSR-CO]UWG47290.1 putative membrane protein [Halanaeroarchaeum sp. HSR-CO]
MDDLPSIRPPHSVASYIEDGARIAAILLVWGVFAAFFAVGVGNIGPQGRGLVGSLGAQLGALFAVVGFLNAVLYVLYRTVDYWHGHRSSVEKSAVE